MLYINLDWDWLAFNSCKCSCKFYKIHHLWRHFICGFRSRKVAPVDKNYGSHFGSRGLKLFAYTATVLMKMR